MSDIWARVDEAIDTDPLQLRDIVAELLARAAKAEAGLAEARAELAELRDLRVGLKQLTTDSGGIDMSLHMAHDMMRALVAAFVKILDEPRAPNYVEMRFSLRDDPNVYTITIQRPGGKTPGEVADEAKQQARQAETKYELTEQAAQRWHDEYVRIVAERDEAGEQVAALQRDLAQLRAERNSATGMAYAAESKRVALEAALNEIAPGEAERVQAVVSRRLVDQMCAGLPSRPDAPEEIRRVAEGAEANDE